MGDDADADLEAARERIDRYEAAGPLQRAALKLVNQAPDRVEREQLRRHRIGLEGRVAEDVSRAVALSEPVWDLLAELGLPEDISRRELADIRESVVGRPTSADVSTKVSLRLSDNEVSIAAVRNLFPGLAAPHAVDGYRYATWTEPDTGAVEPFVVALSERRIGLHSVVATMFVGATFLRYEQEFGTVRRRQLERFAAAVAADLHLISSARDMLIATQNEAGPTAE